VEFTPAQELRAARLLELAEGLIAARVPGIVFGTPLEDTFDLGGVDQTLTVEGTFDSTLVLPARPLTAVASVTIDGQTLPAYAFDWSFAGTLRVDPHADYSWIVNGPTDCRYSWGGPQAVVEVTGTFGPVEPAVVALEAQMVVSVWDTAAGGQSVAEEEIGSYRARYSGYTNAREAGLRLPADADTILARYLPGGMSLLVGRG
jgi:hypothetical protein